VGILDIQDLVDILADFQVLFLVDSQEDFQDVVYLMVDMEVMAVMELHGQVNLN